MTNTSSSRLLAAAIVGALAAAAPVHAADKELLDILLGNGAITADQHEMLMQKEELTAKDLASQEAQRTADVEARIAAKLDETVDAKVEAAVAEKTPTPTVIAEHAENKPGFTFTTADGRFSTNLLWRAQMRFTTPNDGDPRQIADFDSDDSNDFQMRRLRMKIGGHAFAPWVGYYFEVDLQPQRAFDDASTASSSRVIDWRMTLDKYKEVALRIGQWKIDYNRERVDSSGKQQFVERSIVNRIFTVDRQVGVQARGHLFAGTPADMRYYLGVFNGEGRSVENDNSDMLYMGRLQWNFLGRDLKWQQTDVEFTEKPTGSLAFAAATNTGRCTRWSSSGCGNLDGFLSPANAAEGQYETEQYMQEFAFKYRGFSVQEEFHWKTVTDTINNVEYDLTGAYAQAGYFFHDILPFVPRPLEFAFRYAFVNEPNRTAVGMNNNAIENNREEFTFGANWFFAGHNNKLTADVSHLTIDDGMLNQSASDNRVRVQWDVSL